MASRLNSELKCRDFVLGNRRVSAVAATDLKAREKVPARVSERSRTMLTCYKNIQKEDKMKKLEEKNGYEIKRFQPLTLFAIAALLACALPVVTGNAQVAHNSGFYDNQIIEYEATARVTSSPQAAQQLSKGNIVYH